MSKSVNFRDAYKSDHLGAIDLEEMIENGTPLLFTITKIVHGQQKVAGNNGIFNVAHFAEGIKPWALNSGNASIVRKLSGSKSLDPNNWNYPIRVELYVDYNVKFGKDIVSGVRVKEFSTLTQSKPVDNTNALALLNDCKTLSELQSVFLSLKSEERNDAVVFAKKEELKNILK